MSQEINQTLETISKLVPTVSTEHEAFVQAIEEETSAEAALLERVVAEVRPALRALSSRIKVGYRMWWVDCTTDDETTYSETRGVCLGDDDNRPGPYRRGSRGNDGPYEGSDLFLTSEGTWLELTYDGHWSKWQGSSQQWEAREETLTLDEVAERYDVPSLLRRLAARLEAQAKGSLGKRTEAARKRAAVIQGLVAVLG